MSLLEVKNLVVEFPGRRGTLRALDDISFSIAPGEILGVVGESGAGKSLARSGKFKWQWESVNISNLASLARAARTKPAFKNKTAAIVRVWARRRRPQKAKPCQTGL